jgi:hypothetical protein
MGNTGSVGIFSGSCREIGSEPNFAVELVERFECNLP